MATALAQMGRYYRYPTGGYLGLTNSKLSDAQAGYEKAMSPTLAAAAGIDFIVVGGLLDALMTFDFGQLVIDHEISLMMKRFRQHLAFGDLDGIIEEIGAAGPAGMYVGNVETRNLMKSCALLPGVANRERREEWRNRGSIDAHAHALATAKRLLCNPNAALIDPETDARVKACFAGLVPGDAEVPEHWRSLIGETRRTRGTGRRGGAAPR
jgi:trimethylamine--corrinoid protein Co-methyltransferase